MSSHMPSEMEGKILFKYLDLKGAKGMLENGNLQFTRAPYLNDPFDCYPHLIDFSGHGNDYNRQLYLTRDDSIESYVYAMEMLKENLFICSLSEVFNSISMWSYYNRHEGVCIGLDIEETCNSLEKNRKHHPMFLPPFEVQYMDKLVKYDHFVNPKIDPTEIHHLLSVKSTEWAHEREVRMVVSSPLYHYPNCYRAEIGGECFYSIYLGLNIDWSKNEDEKGRRIMKEDIIRLARERNPNIKIYQMQANPDAFKLDPIEINL